MCLDTTVPATWWKYHQSEGGVIGVNTVFRLFTPLLWLNFARTFSAFLVSRKALTLTGTHTHTRWHVKLGLRPVRMRIRNVVNVALFRAEEACETLPLISTSSCMTGIIRPVFLNEAGCLSFLSSPPLLPANPHPFPPPKKDGWNDLSPRRYYRCLAVCSCLCSASLGRPVLHYGLIVLVSLNHLRGWQEVRKDVITRLKTTPVSASCICYLSSPLSPDTSQFQRNK